MSDEKRLIELMVLYQAGRPEAFNEFYRQVKSKLYKFLIVKCLDRQLAEDLLQETFLQIHRSRRTYLPGKPVTPWIFSIAHHVFLSERRARMKRKTREEGLEDHLRDFPVPPDIEATAETELLKSVLTRLPPEQRESLLLHHYWGFSFREIAATLGIRTVTAKLRAHRGLKKIREYLNIGDVTEHGSKANKNIYDSNLK
ncbi:MAG: RNA polymerase sigma factor [Acidobacteriota bacterium]